MPVKIFKDTSGNAVEVKDIKVCVDGTWRSVYGSSSVTAQFITSRGTAPTTQKLEFKNQITLPTISGVTGYNHTGWTCNGTNYSLGQKVTMYGSMVFTAVWTSVPYSVYLYSDGSLYSTLTTTYGSSVSLPSLTKTNFSFNGWSNGGTYYNYSVMVYSNMTLTALWTRNAYTISLYSGGSLQRTLTCAPGGSCNLGGSYVYSTSNPTYESVLTSLSNVNSDYTLYECILEDHPIKTANNSNSILLYWVTNDGGQFNQSDPYYSTSGPMGSSKIYVHSTGEARTSDITILSWDGSIGGAGVDSGMTWNKDPEVSSNGVVIVVGGPSYKKDPGSFVVTYRKSGKHVVIK